MTDRTILRLSDERKRLVDQAEEIVAADPSDDPPMSDFTDAVLTHPIESKSKITFRMSVTATTHRNQGLL